MTGGSLPAQTWHDIMVAAHQGVEVRDIAGYPAAGPKVAAPAASTAVAANGLAKPPDIKPGPPPILTKRGADILVQVEKLLDDAAKTAGDPAKPIKPVSANPVAFPDSFAAATPGIAATPAPRKN
jgi:penicillin-binding protein 1A